jgi:hypothetical protein
MEIIVTMWNFILSHGTDILGGLGAIKMSADTLDSIKKLVPEKLETKEQAQNYLVKSATLLNDQNIKVEEKQWELTTRQELAKSMVRLSAIEATYNVARAGLIMAYFSIAMHFLVRVIMGIRTHQKE